MCWLRKSRPRLCTSSPWATVNLKINDIEWKSWQLEDIRRWNKLIQIEFEIPLVSMQSGRNNLTLDNMETNGSEKVVHFESKQGYGQTTLDETSLYIQTLSIVIFVAAIGLCIRLASHVFVRKCVLGFAQGSWMDQHDDTFSRKLGQLWVPSLMMA